MDGIICAQATPTVKKGSTDKPSRLCNNVVTHLNQFDNMGVAPKFIEDSFNVGIVIWCRSFCSNIRNLDFDEY
jgi:hypothetical protein